MPELKNNFTGGKMNKDLDERLVPRGQYRDAWNVQVSTTDESDIGSLQNILGNAIVNNNVIPADSVCVGSVIDEKNNILYLLLASQNRNLIISWDSVTQQITPVFVDSNNILQYDKTRLITGINIVDDMLFWTDNFSEPKRINIPRSIEGTHPSGNLHTRLIVPERGINITTGGSGIPIVEENVTVIKKGPKVPPVLRLESSGSTSIKLYCGQPYPVPFSPNVSGVGVAVGSDIDIYVKNLIDGYYGNVLHDYYKVGDTLYLKAVRETPTGTDPDLEDKWSKGIDNDHDIKLTIFQIDNTDRRASVGYHTRISCTIESLTGNLYSDIYTVTNLSEPELIFEKKFPRFATRWKYSDGEYSSFSPFSQIAFSPGSFSYHPTKGFNLGMVNTLYAAHVEQFIPQDVPDDVVAVDILYREAGSPVIYVVDTIRKNDPLIPGFAFNYWNSKYDYNTFVPSGTLREDLGFKGTYKITSDTISKAISENQNQRHWDNVPRKALAQEIVGNRLVYGNYIQNYNLYPGIDESLPYKASFELNIEDYNKKEFQLPRGSYYDSLPSIKSLRTYQVGIVYEDDYGRQTPVLTSESGVIKTNKNIAKKQHRLTIRPLTDAPDWATSFKYFIKETSSEYYNLAMDRVFDAEDGNVWLSFPSSDRAKVDEETYLILKKDAYGAFVQEKARYKILSVKNEAPDFIKLQASGLDTVSYNNVVNSNFLSTGLFASSSSVPVKNAKVFEIDGDRHIEFIELSAVFAQKRAEKTIASTEPLTLGQEDIQISLRIINESNTQYNGRSQWYKVDKVFNSNISSGFEFTMEKPFEEDIEFSYVLDGGDVSELFDETQIVFRQENEEHKSWFDGRFFVKIERDLTVDNKVISTPTKNWIKVAQNRLYYIHSGEGKQLERLKTNTQDTRYPGKNTNTSPYNDFNGDYELYGAADSVFQTRIADATNQIYDPTDPSYGASQKRLEALIPQVGVAIDYSGEKFYTPTNNQERAYDILEHYIGNNQFDPTTGVFTPTINVNPYIQESFWFIDRAYYIRNNTTREFSPGSALNGRGGIEQDETHVGGNATGNYYLTGSSYDNDRMPGMRLNEDESPRTITISFTEILDPSFNGKIGTAHEFSLNNHPDQKDFAQRLRPGTKVKFSDDQTAEDGGPVMRTIEKVEGPFSIITASVPSGFTENAKDPWALRLTWHITFKEHFGNPVYNTKGYNPLYTLKDVNIQQDDGTFKICPETDCTGGATYPWAIAGGTGTASAHSTDNDNVAADANPTIMEIYEDQYSIGDSEKVIAESPVIWETEPKQDTDIDLYYEASGSYPVNIINSTTQPVRPGAIVKVSESNPDYFNNDVDGNGDTWLDRNDLNTGVGKDAIVQSIDFSLNVNLGNTANIGNLIRIEEGTILDIIFKGTKIQVVVEEDINDTTYTADNSIRIAADFHSNLVSLDWFNCYIFGEDIGVESDRIRDDFNQVTIDNGPKVSTTVIEGRYKEERRKNGLIFSGIYNSMSGVNNLNQFILGENNIKELNPSYGSIQKLHTRDTDLITLCENKVLKILANKDALFNADGNLNLTSSKNVLGQAVPFVGEYGISKNPESFASESYRAYFTDAKRGAVIRLSRDGLSPISDFGMRNWFADYFVQDERTMLDAGADKGYVFGSYDTKKKHYNVTFSDLTVSFSEDAKGWVSFKSIGPRLKQYDETIVNTSSNYPIDFAGFSLNNKYYTFRDGGLYQHYLDNQNYNNFYGFQFNSSVNLVLNDSPEIVKSFNTLNYEGSESRIEQITTATVNNVVYNDQEYYNLVARDGWFVNSIVTDRGKSTEQHGSVNEFIEKEGKWFNYIKGETTNINNIDPSETSLQGIGLPNAISTPTTIYGCTDPNATNYNSAANIDDGSCVLCVFGCTNSAAGNFNVFATCDDGSCAFFGCTNTGAFNYQPSATVDDGSCSGYFYGCLDPNATNYNSMANTWCSSNTFDFNALNNWTQTIMDGGAIGGSASDNCCIYPIPGCTDPLATNYDPGADTDDNSCSYAGIGCPDPMACDYYNGFTGCINDPDGVQGTGDEFYEAGNTSCCTYCQYGCMDNTATNYSGPGNTNGLPITDTPCDGSAASDAQGATCIAGKTGINCCCDGVTGINTGCMDATAVNYNPAATQSDGSCCYAGCGVPSHNPGPQPDVNGYCVVGFGLTNSLYNHNGYIGIGNSSNYIGASYVGICDPANGITQGCGKCVVGAGLDLNGNTICGGLIGNSTCGNQYINYDPALHADCFGTDFDCIGVQNGSDVSCCVDSVYGCMDPNADNYDPNATADDGNCQYPPECCDTNTSCNYAVNGVTTPGNVTADPNQCSNNFGNCDYQSCQGCVDPTIGFRAGRTVIGANSLYNGQYACRGSSYSAGLQTANLWYYTPAQGGAAIAVCSKDGTLDSISSIDGSDNRDGWLAENYCPDCDLPAFWGGVMQHNPNNLPLGTNCNYSGSGCTDGGQYDPSEYGITHTYVNQAAIDIQTTFNNAMGPSPTWGLSPSWPTTPAIGYQYGSITPGQAAANYDPFASVDDGSCYPVIRGCLDNTQFNYGASCLNQNYAWGWGDPNTNPLLPPFDSNQFGTQPFLDANVNEQTCCLPEVYGCTDNTANRFTHDDQSVGSTSGPKDSVMYGGMGYNGSFFNNTGSLNDAGYILAYTFKGQYTGWQDAIGAFNYDPASPANTLQPGFFSPDLNVEPGLSSLAINGNTVMSVLPAGFDHTSPSDISYYAGSGNETGCCYMAGCLDPTAFNYDYGRKYTSDDPSSIQNTPAGRVEAQNAGIAGGTGTEKLNYFFEGETLNTTCVDCTNATGLSIDPNNILDIEQHTVCADCAGVPATAYHVDIETGLAPTSSTTLSVLSAYKVQEYANKDCCCYISGCMDDTDPNYNPAACSSDPSACSGIPF